VETQVDLFDGLPASTAFERYHEDNPQVYAKLREFALEAVRAGRTHLGIAMLYERARWYTQVEARDGTEWKLNNTHRAYYARLLMFLEPELRGVFELRTSKADAEIAAPGDNEGS
jgi:hypothetical protein